MVAFLELHDARIGMIRVESSGAIEIEFKHISGHFPTPAGGAETWSCTATLRLQGSSRFAIDGAPAARDYVTEGVIRDALGQPIELPAVMSSRFGAGSLEFLFAGSGSRISATFAELTIDGLQRSRVLEER